MINFVRYKNVKKGILNTTKEDFEVFLSDNAIPKYRATQVFQWIYKMGRKSFFDMPNIGKTLQNILDDNFYIYRPEIVSVLKSSDQTVKFLLKLADENTIETVFIPTSTRNTICVSSQVGCSVGCKFCNTGYNGFIRNLTTEEIIGQYITIKDYFNFWDAYNGRISNIVFMGMGEPLYNIDNVLRAIDVIIDQNFDGISRRKITLSTSGIVPVLIKIAPDLKCKLAISLHAPNNHIRSKIMPINNLYDIKRLIEACQIYYSHHPFLTITFEYLLLKDINDTPDCARELVTLIKDLNAKVNLIQFNSWEGCFFQPSSKIAVRKFAKILNDAGIEAPIRERRGNDIMAACGQLQSAIRDD